jgi:hypothetical protein
MRFDVGLSPAITVTESPAVENPELAERLRSLGLSHALARTWVQEAGEAQVAVLLRGLAPAGTANRAARLAVIHRVVASRTPAEREADKAAFLAQVSNPADRTDFDRFAWMSARNAAAIFRFWEARTPDAFTSLP